MSELIEELVDIQKTRVSAVLATVVNSSDSNRVEPGAKCLVRDGKISSGDIKDKALLSAIAEEARTRLKEERSKLISLDLSTGGGKVDVYLDVMLTPPKLIVVGAGHIAVPLAKIAKLLDFHVTVIDDRILFANRERFPEADEVLVGEMSQTLKGITITPTTYIVLVTRGHVYDEPCLREVIHSPARYIGMIGSRRRVKACFHRFREEEKIAEEVIERVHAPIGLDIRAETPEEIAVSIIAELIQVRRGGKGGSLSASRLP
ncbi:MAG: xanthine dehydrogenase [Deltaproteobacteria bacterium]|nr:xanthine dehydrogenase [Deltaproteobacteria bacterium]